MKWRWRVIGGARSGLVWRRGTIWQLSWEAAGLSMDSVAASTIIGSTTLLWRVWVIVFNFVVKLTFRWRFSENLTRFESLVTGPEMSLIVLLNTSTDDYYFNLFNGPGFRILIFDENEFPDSNSGGVIEEMARPGRETFLRVDPVTVEASTNIMTYSVETRGCYYPTEWRNRYGGDYKRTTCILNCRIRSLIALCQCVPFYYYLNTYLPNQSQMPSVCTLQHVACLEKYRIKIQMVVTKIEPIIGLEREMEEALYCPECHPSCSRISYSVQSTSLPLIIQERNSTVMP